MPSKWDELVRDFDALTRQSTKAIVDPGKKMDPDTREKLLKLLKRLWALLLESWDRARDFWKNLEEDEREEFGNFFKRLLRNPRLWTELSDEERARIVKIVRTGFGLDKKNGGGPG